MPRLPGFIGGSDIALSPMADCEDTMNLYVAQLPRSAKNALAHYPTPGQTTLLTVADVGGRGLLDMNGRTLGVMGGSVYSLDVALAAATLIGAVAQDSRLATITMNGSAGNQAFITSGGNGYTLDLATDVLTQVLTNKATQGGMLDGYFIAFDALTSRISISDLNDGLTWDPTQFAARSDAPDNWQAMLVNAPDIYLLGSQSGSVWYDAGNFPFPFAPRPGATFKYGIAAPFSLASAGDVAIWLSHNVEGAGIVVQARSYTPTPISTPAVERAISEYARDFGIDDAEGWSYSLDGHTFYVLTFRAANATWLYDTTTDVWTKAGTWVPAQNRYDAWQPRVHCHASGEHIVAEPNSGRITILDSNIGTESDGSAIRRYRVTPALFRDNLELPHRNLDLILETGLGTSTGQGVEPLIMLEVSDDGGKTFLTERTGSAGKIGKTQWRLRFEGLGYSRNRVYRISMSDPIPWRIVDAYFNNDTP